MRRIVAISASAIVKRSSRERSKSLGIPVYLAGKTLPSMLAAAKHAQRHDLRYEDYVAACVTAGGAAASAKAIWSVAGRAIYGDAYQPRRRGTQRTIDLTSRAEAYFERVALARCSESPTALILAVLERIAHDDLIDAVLDD